MLDNITFTYHKRRCIHNKKANICHVTCQGTDGGRHPFPGIIRETGRNTDETIWKEP